METIVTKSGAKIEATVTGDRVSISQDGAWAGDGRLINGRIVDCAARLGAGDGSESDAAYEALDEAIREAQ